jgi:cob(I)alamin adenosyltransferase
MAKKMMSISTKTGDTGQSGLANGQRLGKEESVFGVLGQLDELNSWVGLVAAKFIKQFPEQQAFLFEIQETIFVISAELALSTKTKLGAQALIRLENKASALQASLADGWHDKFLLPGGTEIGATIDIARAVCRRVEREVVIFHRQTAVSPIILKYLNRLSDYLYLLRCMVNHAVLYHEQEFRVEKLSKK